MQPAGVVADLEAQRTVRAVAGGCEQGLGALDALPSTRLAFAVPRRLVAGDAGRHQRAGRRFPRAHDPARDEFAIHDQRERAAHPHVVQRRVARVEAVEIYGQVRADPKFLRQVVFQPGHARHGHGVAHVQFARAVARQFARQVGNRQVAHPVDSHGRRIAILGVTLQHKVRAGHLGHEAERAARHPAVGGHIRAARRRRGVGKQLRQPGHGPEQADPQPVRRIGENAHVRGCGAPRRRIGQPRHRVEQPDMGRGGRGVRQPPKGHYEVGGGHRPAVRPARRRIQLEAPLEAVRGDLPGARGARHGLCGGVQCGEPLVKITQNVQRRLAARLQRIERLRVGIVAAHEFDGRPGRAGRRRQARAQHHPAQHRDGAERHKQPAGCGTRHLNSPAARYRSTGAGCRCDPAGCR